MNDQIRVGCDVDGVLRDLFYEIDQFLAREFPELQKNPAKEDHWKIEEQYDSIPELHDIIFKENAHEIFKNAPFYDGALGFFYELKRITKKYNARLVVVTHQAETTNAATLEWLGQNKVPVEELFLVPLYPREPKTLARCNFLIDDFPKNLYEQEEKFGGAITVKRPWNRECSLPRYEPYEKLLHVVEQKLDQRRKESDGTA